MKGVEVVYYKKEKPDWRAEIKEALFSRNETESELKDVKILYFRGDLSLHSKEGFYDITNGQIRLSGMVNGKGKGFTFKSPELLYLPSEDILTTSKGLVIRGKKYMLSGRSGRIKDSQVMEVTGNVRAVFY
ncbi:MAG: LPS export ABC transporter periplasmic protein LptC [Nitrospirae bacterium]|nr:LPS export ABC transporter periplasmic protein LptC [Nitrospirota bacterium]